ncbi:hypothetical protein [Flavobacterium granuli]|uniref:Uncharacterized protein n=1 Tax=Flavobacterium granuli TaxID=280093 RepID=A0A1M5R297_9FLAO|nr:hypothetical protein [Flavobacterium granuli]PRZ21575.1 hypothetical protein BC624_10813 [Flavobacterium granuli]SHH20206.1 hypothetical protein SAMN05443373_10913 [Flavobacterium granuli]
MINKTKLAFDLLEQEMEVICKEEQLRFVGGSGGYTWQQFVDAVNSGNLSSIPAGSYIMSSSGDSFSFFGEGLNEVIVLDKTPAYSSSGYSSWSWTNSTTGGSGSFFLDSIGYSDFYNGGSAGGGDPTPEWGISDFFGHYNNGNGEPVSLFDMGLRDDVISSDIYLQMMTNVNNQIENFVHNQVAQGSNYPGTFQFSWDFNNSYDFTLEAGLFAVGSATIAGQFSGTFTIDNEGKINVNGYLDLNFHDRFEDPWDLLNATNGSWDPTGTPYDINDNWQQEILMQNIVP